MSFDERQGKDVLTSVTPRSMRARAELHRTKLRGEEELRKEQKEAESQKVSSQHATRPKRGSDSSIALKKPQIPSVTIDAGSPEVKRTPEQRGQKEEEQDLPRRLRNTLEGDLYKATKKGEEVRWDRIQKEKMKKWSSLDLDILQSSSGDLRRMAFTPPLRRANTSRHERTRSQSPSLRKTSDPKTSSLIATSVIRSSSMSNLPAIDRKPPPSPSAKSQKKDPFDVQLPPISPK
jgi:hypothetical protein